MKKIVCITLIALLLGACGSDNDYYVCKFKDKKQSATMHIEYDDDTLTKINIETYQTVSKDILDQVGATSFEDYLTKNVASLEMDGVKVETKYRDAKQEVTIAIEVDVENLNTQNYDIFMIPKDRDLQSFMKRIKAEAYVCND